MSAVTRALKHLNGLQELNDSTSAGLIPRSLLCKGACQVSQSPSFPHVFSGNPGKDRMDPRLKHSGVTNSGHIIVFYRYPQLAAGWFICSSGAERLKPSTQLSALIYLPISRKVSGV